MENSCWAWFFKAVWHLPIGIGVSELKKNGFAWLEPRVLHVAGKVLILVKEACSFARLHDFQELLFTHLLANFLSLNDFPSFGGSVPGLDCALDFEDTFGPIPSRVQPEVEQLRFVGAVELGQLHWELGPVPSGSDIGIPLALVRSALGKPASVKVWTPLCECFWDLEVPQLWLMLWNENSPQQLGFSHPCDFFKTL